MLNALKTINNIMRVVFIGFTVVFAIVKIFDVGTKDNFENTESNDYAASEFDEIW